MSETIYHDTNGPKRSTTIDPSGCYAGTPHNKLLDACGYAYPAMLSNKFNHIDAKSILISLGYKEVINYEVADDFSISQTYEDNTLDGQVRELSGPVSRPLLLVTRGEESLIYYGSGIIALSLGAEVLTYELAS